MPTTGKELRAARLAADVQIQVLAKHFGKSRATLWVLEKSATVPADDAARYRKALANAIETARAAEAAAEAQA
jgi:predicted transcriptional regulator